MAEAHEESHDKLYLMVAAALGGLTVVSYLADLMGMPHKLLVLVVLCVAVVKASLVATFFMHLNLDWTKVRVMLIPAAILAAVLVFALLPDITIAGRGLTTWAPKETQPKPAAAAPDSSHH